MAAQSYFFGSDWGEKRAGRIVVGGHNKLAGLYELSADSQLQLAQCQSFPHKIPSPADDGIPPSKGDDTSPPNSVKPGTMNALATYVLANVGFSTADAKSTVPPSAISYDITVLAEQGGGVGLAARVMLEFTNPHPGQSMMVWAKKLKQFVSDEKKAGQELTLIDTKFQV